jgi:hypothetical protein
MAHHNSQLNFHPDFSEGDPPQPPQRSLEVPEARGPAETGERTIIVSDLQRQVLENEGGDPVYKILAWWILHKVRRSGNTVRVVPDILPG